jgi:hypothetical protein
MSEETQPEATPGEVPASPPGASAKGGAAPAAPLKPQTSHPKPSAPIDYALPTQKKPWLPTPGLIRNLGCLFKLVVGFTVLICMGYFALVALNPKTRQWALQGTKPGPGGAPPSGKGPTPFKFVNQILAIPAQALGKTDDVVKANNARVGQLDGVIADEEKAKVGRASSRPVIDPFGASGVGGVSHPDKSAPDSAEPTAQAVSSATLIALAEKNTPADPAADPTPTPSPLAPRLSPQAPDTPDQLKLPGGIIIAQASPAGAPRASAAFFYAIVKLSISGITQGKPARALINNRLAYEGDEINRALGITFAQLDPANKRLVFKDQTGATVTRSY